MYSSAAAPSSSWRDHVQDQEEELVRELMQADDVDAVLARMEGDHFRHLSPVMRKLNAFDGSAPPQPNTNAARSPRSPALPGQRPPPPPPPPMTSSSATAAAAATTNTADARPYSARRRLSGNLESRDEPQQQQQQPSAVPHHVPAYGRRSSYHHHDSASSSSYQPHHHDSDPGDFSPAARPPPPPPPPPLMSDYAAAFPERDPLDAYRRPATAATAAPPRRELEIHEPFDAEAESRYHATMDSWLKPDRNPPFDLTRDSPHSSAQRTNPFTATRPPTYAAVESSAISVDGMLPPPTPGSPWTSSGGRYHGHASADQQYDTRGAENARGAPRVTTTTTSPRRSEIGELENASQSRIARQLQLLRNYRELAELCSNTRDPSVDLFQSLPSEELARMQAEQLQQLPRREQSPITVNNNYYFDGSGSRRGSGGGGGGRSGHSPGRSGRGRVNSSDTVGALSKTGAGGAGGAGNGGQSRSVSELFTVDSHHGMTSHHPSGASSSQPPRPPLLPSPRVIPLQSPQPSSGPDSPVATPPLSQRSMGGGASITAGTSGVLAPPLAPPSPSRSYRARSHRSRVHDAHYTPTATTEEAGSSYDEDNVDEDDYAGDFMDNDVDGEDVEDDPYEGDEYDDATAPRPPPPRIIEREQHRRFPNAAGNGDYTTSGGQPPLSPNSSQQQQQLQQQFPQQQQQQQMQMQNNSYPGDYVTSASGNATNDLPGNGLPGTNAPSGTSRNMSSNNHNSTGISGGGVAGSDGGRRSVSSAINVLSGDQELRANAQLGASGMVDSRRGSHSQNMPPTQQQQQQERITAFNGNSSQPLPNFSQRPQQKRRSLSAGSSPPQRRRDAGAYTDPGMNSFSGDLSMSDMRPYDRRGSNGTPEKRMGGASNGSTGGYNGNRHRGSHANNNNSSSRRAEVMGSRRQDTRRGGRGRNYGGNERRRDLNSDGDSTYSNEDDDENVDRDSYDNDYTVTEGDTPGNPQLQTHNPRSSAMRKKQQQQQQQHGNARGNVGGRPLMNTAGGRGRQRDGAADDGTVHTPRHQNVASRRRRDDRNGRRNGPSQQQQQQREDARRRGRRGSGATPSSPYYDDNGVEVNSASSYSYSYTTSSDISDYIAGSYYSPIKEQLPGGGRGAGAGGGGGGAVRSPMRGRGRGNPSPTTTPTRASGPMRPGGYPDRGGGAGSGGQGYGPTTSPNSAARNSPQRGRGRGVGGRGRGMNPSNVMGGGGGGGPSNAYYNSAVPANAPYGRGRGGAGGVMAGPQSANRRAAPPGSALGELDGRGSNLAFGSAPQRQQTQLPSGSHTTLQGGGPAGGTGMRSPRRSGNLFPTAEGGASVEAAATNVRPNAFVQLPDGRAVPANSPAGRQVRQMQQQQQQQQQARMRQQQLLMHQRQQQMQGGGQRAGPMPNIAATAAAPVQPSVQPFGYSPSGGFYPVGTTAVSRPVSPQRPQQQQQQQPVATTPMRNRRAASPSAAPSTSPAGRSTTSAAGAVHIHPGLLYGSLLPKARPKTALVVEDDERGREHSVAPHGDTTHEPFMDRGSVCPVQPTVVNFVPARTNFAGPPQPQPLDTFPVSSAIHGTTADGVQPLAWKSGGAGCVVSRSGHLPPAPDTKLSSHYRNPATSPSQQQQYAPAARTGVMSGAASSVGGNTFVSGNAPQRGQSVVGIMQTPQHFNALRPTAAGGRRDSAFSLQSDAAATAQQQQHQSAVVAAGANSSQQRYVPLQEPLEQPRGANYGRRRSSPAVVDPYSSAGRTAANRSANIQRFGIAPLQG